MARGGGEAGPRRGGGEAGRRREAERLAGGGEAGWRLGDGEAGRQRGAAADEQAGRGGRRGRTRRGDEQGRRAEELWRRTRAQRHKIPFPTPIFPAPVRGSAIFPARCSFSRRWSVSRLLDRAGTNFRAILRVLRSITRRRVITRTITRDERLNGRLMGNRRADPRVARNID